MPSSLFAQNRELIEGKIWNKKGDIVAGATVSLSNQNSTTSQSDGSFYFTSVSQGQHTLTVVAVGYQPYEQAITKIEKQSLQLKILLDEETKQVSEVTVIGKTETQQVKEQAIRAVVVDTRAVAEQPVTLAELMNRAPGIRIRQSGGLGNQVDVSINGFQGNSVQYFRDGIPLEYLGGGYGINNVPINQLERVEVYRGVVPVSLGGDALGGAVNLITNKHLGTNLNTSYEIASFNTHIANLSLHHRTSRGWMTGIDAFYNYSDNNYKADVEVTNEFANYDTVTVPLFHNRYKHHFVEAFVGIENRSWADLLKLSVANYGIQRESQHPALMTNPYGAVKIGNKGTFVPSIRYKKTLLDKKLSIDQFASYSLTNRSRTDTIRGTFDWYGNFTPRTGGNRGESPNPSLADIDFTNILSRTNVSYSLNDQNTFQANMVINYSRRLGNDPLGFRFAGTDVDVLSKRATYQKNIAGLEWESKWLDSRLTNQLFVKYFNFKSSGINAFLSNDTDLNKFTNVSNSNWGVGNAIKYQLSDNSLIRGSVELTNRLPRVEELFGDNDTRAPNFNLQPERSFNVNLGYRQQGNKYSFEVNTFYRKTDGMILLIPIQSPFAQYQNLDSIRGFGFDLDGHYSLTKHVEIFGNVTWQDNRMTDVGTTLYQWTEGTRLRNTPFFFANLGITGNIENVFGNGDLLRPYLYWNYIREFYLIPVPRDKEPQGFLGIFGSSGVSMKDLVPDQTLLTAGFNYKISSRPLSLGFEVKNIANSKLYDYYKVQRPGRSVHLKLTYQINTI